MVRPPYACQYIEQLLDHHTTATFPSTGNSAALGHPALECINTAVHAMWYAGSRFKISKMVLLVVAGRINS